VDLIRRIISTRAEGTVCNLVLHRRRLRLLPRHQLQLRQQGLRPYRGLVQRQRLALDMNYQGSIPLGETKKKQRKFNVKSNSTSSMKKKFTSQSAFFNLRVLLALGFLPSQRLNRAHGRVPLLGLFQGSGTNRARISAAHSRFAQWTRCRAPPGSSPPGPEFG
jgi:hypothetical protein